MNAARKLLIVVIAVVLAGCQTLYWRHAWKNQQQYYQDNAQCLAMSSGGGSNQVYYTGNNSFLQGYNIGSAMAASQNQQNIYSQCMMGNGWYLSKN